VHKSDAGVDFRFKRLLRAFLQVTRAHFSIDQQRRPAVRGRQQLLGNDRSCRSHDAGTPLWSPRPTAGLDRSIPVVGRTILP